MSTDRRVEENAQVISFSGCVMRGSIIRVALKAWLTTGSLKGIQTAGLSSPNSPNQATWAARLEFVVFDGGVGMQRSAAQVARRVVLILAGRPWSNSSCVMLAAFLLSPPDFRSPPNIPVLPAGRDGTLAQPPCW